MASPVILVVDDEPLNLDIIEEFLAGKGQPYIVERANDGVEAMAKLTTIDMMWFCLIV